MNRVPLFLTTVLLAFGVAGQARSALIISDFSVNADGWTAAGATFAHISAGGNPGGFVEFGDSGAANYRGVAPAKFLGNISAFDGGTISFDEIRITGVGTPDLDFGVVTISSSTDSASLDLVSGGPGSVWASHSAPLTAAAWGKTTAAWLALLSGVTDIRVGLEAFGGSDSTGLDNFAIESVAISVVPEPSTLTLLGIGCLALLGYRWRKRGA